MDFDYDFQKTSNKRLEVLLEKMDYEYSRAEDGWYTITLGFETHFAHAEAIPQYIWDNLEEI